MQHNLLLKIKEKAVAVTSSAVIDPEKLTACLFMVF